MDDLPVEGAVDNIPARSDPRLGVTIGALLSILCIIVCMFIIIRHRRCMKPSHPHTNLNGDHVRNTFSNQLGTDRSVVTTTATFLSSPNALSANCTADSHEMQTLILVSSNENIPATANCNGIQKKHESRSNGEYVVRYHASNSDCTNRCCDVNIESENEEHDQDISKRGLISSTPKTKHKPTGVNSEHVKKSINEAKATASSCENNIDDAEYNHNVLSSEAEKRLPLMNMLTNGSAKHSKNNATLPQYDTHHTTVQANSRQSPLKKLKNDSKLKNGKKATAKSMTSSSSEFDNSQQMLLLDPIGNETNSSDSFENSFVNESSTKDQNYRSNNHENHSPAQYNSYLFTAEGIENETFQSAQPKEECGQNSTKDNSNAAEALKFPNNGDSNVTYQKRVHEYRRPIVGPNG